MIKKLSLLVATATSLFMCSPTALSQEKTKREIRKEKKEQESKIIRDETLRKIESLNFIFEVTELTSSNEAGISNVKFRQGIWDVKVTPEAFNCYLPMRANNYPTVSWSIPETFHVISAPYEISIDDSGANIRATITTSGNGNDKYIFTLSIPPKGGKGALISVKSDFWGPISYRGEIK